MGILVDALFGVVDAHQLQHLDGPGPGLVPAVALVVAQQRLHKLIADGVDRVETGHGVLEDHADPVAAKLAHLLLTEGKDILALKGDGAAGDLAGALQKADDGIGFHALAGAGFAHDAHDLVIAERVGDAVNGLDFTRRGEEGNLEILDLKERFLFVHSRFLPTSSDADPARPAGRRPQGSASAPPP